MTKEQIINDLKGKFPNAKFVGCVGCTHSHSDSEHKLTCKKTGETVAENFVCEKFEV